MNEDRYTVAYGGKYQVTDFGGYDIAACYSRASAQLIADALNQAGQEDKWRERVERQIDRCEEVVTRERDKARQEAETLRQQRDVVRARVEAARQLGFPKTGEQKFWFWENVKLRAKVLLKEGRWS